MHVQWSGLSWSIVITPTITYTTAIGTTTTTEQFPVLFRYTCCEKGAGKG